MKYEELQRQADIYYAYHNIHRYIVRKYLAEAILSNCSLSSNTSPLCCALVFQEEPFTSFFPDALFNMARFLFHSVMSEAPQGVSKV